MKVSQIWGLHAKPGKVTQALLAIIPFLLIIAAYVIASDARLAENPQDKLLPSLNHMVEAMHRMAFVPDRRTGDYLLWADTLASLTRIGLGVGISFVMAVLLGLNCGMYPGARSLLNPFVTFVAMIPPLAILPILFISLGVGEVAKVTLIVIGTLPILTRDIFLSVRSIPQEAHVKALTLGASASALTYRLVLPRILPRAIDSLRLVLGGAWLFLIAAESIAATEGLGYRIFLVRRYLAMDVIIPYVFWITFLGFAFDWTLRQINSKAFPWYGVKKG